jgi:hypothetical protein
MPGLARQVHIAFLSGIRTALYDMMKNTLTRHPQPLREAQ